MAGLKRKNRGFDRNAFDWLEEAVHLLRHAPPACWLTHAAAVAPFLVGFLYFWGDMSRDPAAADRVGGSALILGMLFLWMRHTQAVFASQLYRRVAGLPAPPFSWRRHGRLFSQQAVVQSVGLFMLPVALVLAVPLVWTVSFLQSAAVDRGGSESLRDLVRRAAFHPLYQGRENHAAVFLILLFGFLLYLNAVVMIFMIPGLLNMFFGIESAFTRGGWSPANSTLQITALALAYACADPLLRALHALRVFHEESRINGEDLRLDLTAARDLRRRKPIRGTAVLALAACGFFAAAPQSSADGAGGPPDTTVEEREPAAFFPPDAELLDNRIREVLNQREYRWRLPPPPGMEEEDVERGWFGRLLHATADKLKAAWDRVGHVVRRFFEWLAERLRDSTRDSQARDRSPFDLSPLLRVLLIVLCAVLVLFVAFLLWNGWRRARARARSRPSAAAPAPVDLTSENVSPDALPVDEWIRMAREYRDKGEWRLAVRAYYLGSLAALADRGLIDPARHKSSRDYRRELERRIREPERGLTAYDALSRLYEQAWYGMYPVDGDSVGRMENHYGIIKRDEQNLG